MWIETTSVLFCRGRKRFVSESDCGVIKDHALKLREWGARRGRGRGGGRSGRRARLGLTPRPLGPKSLAPSPLGRVPPRLHSPQRPLTKMATPLELHLPIFLLSRTDAMISHTRHTFPEFPYKDRLTACFEDAVQLTVGISQRLASKLFTFRNHKIIHHIEDTKKNIYMLISFSLIGTRENLHI